MFMLEAIEEFVHVSVALCGLVGFLEARVMPVRLPTIAVDKFASGISNDTAFVFN
jgi:hypothetical protein